MKFAVRILSACLVFVVVMGLLGCNQQTDKNLSQNKTHTEKQINEVTGVKENPVILFMGDSITDGGRTDYKDKTFLGIQIRIVLVCILKVICFTFGYSFACCSKSHQFPVYLKQLFF